MCPDARKGTRSNRNILKKNEQKRENMYDTGASIDTSMGMGTITSPDLSLYSYSNDSGIGEIDV